ncbi:MAG TPA: FecR family protein [Polyangia bacterium]|jgi:hypothetical protein|nr:FecR family protein [Polyangia bacterium]
MPPPAVPPLSEAAIARIERGVFAALDPQPLGAVRPRSARRRTLSLALAGAAVAAAAFVARDARHTAPQPSSAAQVSTTSSGSHIAIAGATLDVAPQSAINIGARDGAVVIALERGSVTCEVAPRSKRAPFIVEAGATRVTVIGTKFSVHRVGEHATVSVDHGLVEVADTNMTELVHAGERFRPGEPVTREPLASEPEAAAAPSAAAPAPVTIAAEVQPTPAPRHHVRRLALALPGQPSLPPRPEAEASAVAEEQPAAAEAPTPPEAAAPTESAPAPQAPPKGRSVQVLFELAAQLEVRDPEAALRIYGELSSGPEDDGWAASALFAAARLEAERGHTSRAHELAASYLQRFPRGPNSDDARTLLGAPAP